MMARRAAARVVLAAAAAAAGHRAASQVPAATDDPHGIAVPYPFVHLVASRDHLRDGTTAELRTDDPWLLYQLGRDLVLRQFVRREGVYGRSGEETVPLYVGTTAAAAGARFARDHAASCASCHSIPYREPGAGQTIASTGGAGRNTPHFYGAGLVEMVGEDIRAALLARYDTNGNGVFDLSEVRGDARARVRPTPESAAVDYGSLALDAFGHPRLNPLFRVWYVDAQGRVLTEARDARDPRVAAFDFVADVFGWGRGYREAAGGARFAQGAEAATLRGIFSLAADVHMGLQSFDPVQQDDGGGAGGFTPSRSLSGARQVDFGEASDRGRRRTATGLSLDDPDGDGVPTELTSGDVDAAEFYMLHAPPPAFVRGPESLAGREVFRRVGCTRCHVEDWRIAADRRLFRLDVVATAGEDGPSFTARVVDQSHRLPSGERAPLRAPFRVRGIYSDFKHWDVGPAFAERRFDGTVQREHRTAPLWGVAGTAPYGTSGQFGTLDEVVRAHAGAAAHEGAAYAALPAAQRRRLLAFLDALVLFPTDRTPADVDGDGRAAARFLVGGADMGYERLEPRFLFARPPTLHVLREAVDAGGRALPLAVTDDAATRRSYRLLAEYRRDSDGDGFADAVDPTPYEKGIGR